MLRMIVLLQFFVQLFPRPLTPIFISTGTSSRIPGASSSICEANTEGQIGSGSFGDLGFPQDVRISDGQPLVNGFAPTLYLPAGVPAQVYTVDGLVSNSQVANVVRPASVVAPQRTTSQDFINAANLGRLPMLLDFSSGNVVPDPNFTASNTRRGGHQRRILARLRRRRGAPRPLPHTQPTHHGSSSVGDTDGPPVQGPVAPPQREGAPSEYRSFGRCNQVCQHCGALFWLEERKKSLPVSARPQNQRCCASGRVVLRSHERYPPYITHLFSDRHFMENIRAYNQMFAMTSFGATIDHSINTANTRRGGHQRRILARLRRRRGAPRPLPHSQPTQRGSSSVGDADGPPVQGPVAPPQREGAPSEYRSFGRCDQVCQHCGALFWLEERKKSLPVSAQPQNQRCCASGRAVLRSHERAHQYELPTADSVGAIVYDGGPEAVTDYDVVIQRHSGEPESVNKLHPAKMALTTDASTSSKSTATAIVPSRQFAYLAELNPTDNSKFIEVKVYRKWTSVKIPDFTPTAFSCMLLDNKLILIILFMHIFIHRKMALTTDASTSSKSTATAIVPSRQFAYLAELNPTDNSKFIEVKVYRKWTSVKIPDFTPTAFSCMLLDNKGSAIQANADLKEKARFDHDLQMGCVYKIQGFGFDKAESWGKTLDNDITLCFGKYTQIELLQAKDFPSHYFNFAAFNQLNARLEKKNQILTDYIGYVHNVEKVKEYGGATTTRVRVRNVGIRNLNNNVVLFTLWNEDADNFPEDEYAGMEQPVILAVSSCYLKRYAGQIQLSATSATRYYFNPQVPETGELLAAYNQANITVPQLEIQTERLVNWEEERNRNRVPLATLLQIDPKTQQMSATIGTTKSVTSAAGSLDMDTCMVTATSMARNPIPKTANALMSCFTPQTDGLIKNVNALLQEVDTKDPATIPAAILALQNTKNTFQFQFATQTQKGPPTFVLKKIMDNPQPPLLQPPAGPPSPPTDLPESPTNEASTPPPATPAATQDTPAETPANAQQPAHSAVRKELFVATTEEGDPPAPKKQKKD
ncbi:nucleic acid-binding, OB-fold protein [Artemisia annua]|uniref:Nucleic acid-binding, OB-fold protein n=1 Tax=Artemisia annua TaxID=35608 RepID=A0A2U1PKX0_ARTAN|nr:nucleic acid-binding, OB-fold protein [Artemisia annua]